MIRVNVSLANASVTETETLTAGRVGLECGFTFSSEWDDLLKVAVFEGEQTIEVALGTASVAVVPPECMATAGYNLRIGVYGLSPANAIVIPTVWAKAGKIKDSASPDEDSFAPATPELVAQIMSASETALSLARRVADAAEAGEFDGVSPTVAVTETTGGHTVTITDRDGNHNFDVMDGASAYAQAVEGGYTESEQQFNTDLARFKTYAAEAESSANAAAASENNAGDSATAAATSATAALNAKTAAEQARTSAAQSATNAATSASTASTKAGEAAQSATSAASSAATATQKASAASASATAAAGSATNAGNAASAAAASATTAGNAQTAAETAQGKAEDAQEAAETAQGAAEAAAASVSESAAQIAQNTEDVADLKSAVNNLLINIPFEDDGYLQPDGSVQSAGSFVKTTQFFGLENIKTIVYRVGTAADFVFAAFYDETKTILSSLNGTAKELKTGELELPENAAFVRFTSWYTTSDFPEFYANAVVDLSTIGAIADDVENAEKTTVSLGETGTLFRYFTFEPGDLSDSDGSPVTHNTRQRTVNFIKTSELVGYTFKLNGGGGVYCYYYDSDFVYHAPYSYKAVDFVFAESQYKYVKLVVNSTNKLTIEKDSALALKSEVVSDSEFEEIINEESLLMNHYYKGATVFFDERTAISDFIDVSSLPRVLVASGTPFVSSYFGFDANKEYVDYYSIPVGGYDNRILPSSVKYLRVPFMLDGASDSCYVKNENTGAVVWSKPIITWTKPMADYGEVIKGEINSTGGNILSLHPCRFVEPVLANFNYNLDPMLVNTEYGDKPFVMMYFSDLHATVGQLQRLVEFADAYNQYLTAIAVGGDVVDRFGNGFNWWGENGAGRFLPVVGNHEVMRLESDPHLYVNGQEVASDAMPAYSAKQIYELVFAPYLSETGLTMPVNKCYWYKDFTDCKVRLIGLDDWHWKETVRLANSTRVTTYPDGESTDTGEQLAWFVSTLADAKTNEYRVIVVKHNPHKFNLIQSPFTSLEFQNQYCVTNTEQANAVQDFIDGGGTFLMWMTGHIHQDAFGTVDGYPDQLMMTIDTARFGRSLSGTFPPVGSNYKIANTMSNDCFEVLCVDSYKKCITLRRFGCEYDRNGRHIGSIVYNYETKQVVFDS